MDVSDNMPFWLYTGAWSLNEGGKILLSQNGRPLFHLKVWNCGCISKMI